MHSFTIEKEYWSKGYRLLCGIDEAGRGPIAGPVVAAAVIFKHEVSLPELNDSKQLTESQREKIFDEVILKCEDWATGIVEPEKIDKINILSATMLAMREAVANLTIKPDFLLIDGDRTPKTGISSKTIVKGDAKAFSIAAASVIAKVSRDRIMIELHKKYPEYGFNTNKGYGTPKHIEMVKKIGPSPVHRRTFLNNILYKTISIPYRDSE